VRAAAVVLLALVLLVVVGVALGRHDPIDLVPVAGRDDGVPLRTSRVETAAGIRLFVVDAGPEDGPLVLLLHGFPELWWTWHAQIAALARAGFHVRAPDQRGFDASDKPGPVDAYRQDLLADDVVALIDDAGRSEAFVAGHDFGAIVAWHLVLTRPEWVRRLVVFNVSHPLAWTAPEERDEEQVNWFRTFFQIPLLPELVGPFGDWWLMARYLRATSRPGTFDEPVLSYYRQAWARPGAFGAMIDWYRAAFRHRPEYQRGTPLAVPTKIVFGERDVFNDPRSGPRSVAFCSRCEYVGFPEAGHWVLHEEPEATSRLLVGFFASP